MNEAAAEELARHLMEKHGLLRAGWRFAWGRGKRRLGSAEVRRVGLFRRQRTIRLSRYLVSLNDEPVVRDVLLHEIAHALAGLRHGHGERWKSECRRIGASPQRLAGPEVCTVPPKYEVVCPSCNCVVAGRHRRPSAEWLSRCVCGTCNDRGVRGLTVREGGRDAEPQK